MGQMVAEEQSDKMAFDIEVHMKQRCVIEFLCVEKKKKNQWIAECLQKLNRWSKHSEAVDGTALQQWQQKCESKATLQMAK